MNYLVRPLLAALLAAACPCVLFAADGYFDTGFALGSGYLAFPGDGMADSSSAAFQIIIGNNGNLLVGGPYDDVNWWLAEFDDDGFAVSTFGPLGGGLAASCWLEPGRCSNTGFGALAMQADGRIAIAEGGTISRTLAQAKDMDSGGVVGGNGIPMAGSNGYVSVSGVSINASGGTFSYAGALTQTSDGKWLAVGAGHYDAGINLEFALLRLNTDFSLDQTFNAVTDANNVTFAGGQIVRFAGGSSAAAAVRVLPDGRIVAAGEVASNSIGVARLHADGTPDVSFGLGTAKTVLNWNLGTLEHPNYLNQAALKIDRAGRILIATTGAQISGGVTHHGIAVVRLLSNGVQDASFGDGGVAYQSFADFCTGGGGAEAHALALDSAGRILVAGQCQIGQNYFLLTRLFGDDGSLDTSFGIAGHSYGYFSASSTSDRAFDLTLDHGGRPIVVGDSYPYGGKEQAGVARLTYDLIYSSDFETAPRGRLPGQ